MCVYWHSEGAGGKLRNYHKDKTNACVQRGIRLIHVTDYQWMTNRDLVESRLRAILGQSTKVSARKCTVRSIDHRLYADFCTLTHLQGSAVSSVRYGLYHNNTLVAVMSFAKPRYNREYQWELIRFSTALNTTVVGGASKLFAAFVREYNPNSVISYCDLSWNTGKVYEALGFSLTGTSAPNYRYFHTSNPYKLLSRVAFQKHKLASMLQHFNPELSEWENMQANGYDRILS